jgi:hypothetical protein
LKFVHRITVKSSQQVRTELARFGIVVGTEGLITAFEVDESQEVWPKLQQWITAYNAGNYVTTKFTNEELAEAEWLEVGPTWHHGYPQPDTDRGFLKATYDLTHFCNVCGSGALQNAPFRMKTEPRWTRNHILQLNWIFDQYFVKPEVWEKIFKPFGVACCEVVNKRGETLKTVVQLVVDQHVNIETDGLPIEKPPCTNCGRPRYLPFTRGYFPALKEKPSGHIARTMVYFGSGFSANQYIMVSRKLADAMQSLRGISFWPVAKS